MNEKIIDDIRKANSEIKQIDYTRSQKQKDGTWVEVTNKYSPVNERVIAFRKVFPLGAIITEYTLTQTYVWFKATIKVGGEVVSTGHAREILNKQNAFEVCETSAVGRAIGNLGIGIDVAIASADDMEQAETKEIFDEPVKKDYVNKFTSLFNNKEQVDILNLYHVKSADMLSIEVLKGLINGKENKQ